VLFSTQLNTASARKDVLQHYLWTCTSISVARHCNARVWYFQYRDVLCGIAYTRGQSIWLVNIAHVSLRVLKCCCCCCCCCSWLICITYSCLALYRWRALAGVIVYGLRWANEDELLLKVQTSNVVRDMNALSPVGLRPGLRPTTSWHQPFGRPNNSINDCSSYRTTNDLPQLQLVFMTTESKQFDIYIINCRVTPDG